MARRCDICGKGPAAGRNVSHSHRVTNRRFQPNVHKVRAMIDGAPRTIMVCAKCLKAGKVVRAL